LYEKELKELEETVKMIESQLDRQQWVSNERI
jgi:exonuclease VII small subunit